MRKSTFLFLFLLLPALGLAQGQLRGVVSDGAGAPLAGVIVTVEGSGAASVSDARGAFVLSGVARDAVLNFSLASFVPQRVEVGGRNQLTVTMMEDATAISEVVVVGYGTMRRSDLTGSVASIGAEALQKAGVTSIDQVLSGRAAGVQVSQNSGMPGASASIRIRGVNSLSSSNEPIYVIDGVVIAGGTDSYTNPLSSINPADIESMDILKDASATAIYGAQGSNGVIIVNTRRGRAGNAKVSYNGYVGWQELPVHLDVLNLREYATLRNTKAELGLLNYSNDFVRPDLLGEGTDWQNELFNVAMMHNHSINVSGGNEAVTYSLSGGYSNQDGIAEASGFRRLTLSGSFDARVNEWARAGVNFGFSETQQKMTVSENSLILMGIRTNPSVPVRNVDGSFGMPENNWMGTNPIARALLIQDRRTNYGARANTFLEIAPKFVKGLSYRTEYSFDLNMQNRFQFTPKYELAAWDTNDMNTRTETKQLNVYYSWRNLLTYDRTFGRHKINAMVGHEMSKSRWDNVMAQRAGLPTASSTDINLGDSTYDETGGYTGAAGVMSYFGRAFYSLDDKYLLTATLRRDGSSKFAPDKRWGWFPSMALAWRMSEESFLKDVSWISNLKLRAGWGLVGNQAIPDNNAAISTYAVGQSEWGAAPRPANTANPNLKWESTSSTNIGFDLGLWNDRVDIVFDVYWKNTNNLLMRASLPAYAGTDAIGAPSVPWVNLGALQNRGFEFTVNTRNIETKNFQWSSNFVFSLNRNKVTEMNTETGEFTQNVSDNAWGGTSTLVARSIVGQPIGQFYGYQVIGRFDEASQLYMYNKDGELVRTPVFGDSQGNVLPIDLNAGVWVGDYIYRDVDGNGVINEKDRTFIGNPEPKFTFGFNNNFSYRNWDLGIQLVGVIGNDVVNYSRRYMDNPYYNNSNLFKNAIKYAQIAMIDPEGDENDYRNYKIVGGDAKSPRLSRSSATSDHNFAFSDRFVEDGSYLRIQNVTLGYSLPYNVIKHAGLSALKVYGSVANAYTITGYTGFDPEIGSDMGIRGVDMGRYPSPRIYTVGLNLTF